MSAFSNVILGNDIALHSVLGIPKLLAMIIIFGLVKEEIIRSNFSRAFMLQLDPLCRVSPDNVNFGIFVPLYISVFLLILYMFPYPYNIMCMMVQSSLCLILYIRVTLLLLIHISKAMSRSNQRTTHPKNRYSEWNERQGINSSLSHILLATHGFVQIVKVEGHIRV